MVESQQEDDLTLALAQKIKQHIDNLRKDGAQISGITQLIKAITEYTDDIFNESKKTAKRHGADTPSKSDVDRAKKYLCGTKSRSIWWEAGGAFGLLLMGASLPLLLQKAVNQSPVNDPIPFWLYILSFIGGFILTSLDFYHRQ